MTRDHTAAKQAQCFYWCTASVLPTYSELLRTAPVGPVVGPVAVGGPLPLVQPGLSVLLEGSTRVFLREEVLLLLLHEAKCVTDQRFVCFPALALKCNRCVPAGGGTSCSNRVETCDRANDVCVSVTYFSANSKLFFSVFPPVFSQ